MGRLRHAILTDGLMDWAADRTIVYATAYNRPAIIVPWFDQVELVSTLGAVLRLPQIAGFRVYRQTLGAAVTITPDFRKCVATADKRIVAGHAAIIIQAHNDPLVISQILRRVRAQVRTAFDLPESAREELRKKLSEVSGKDVLLEVEKDESLIGGVVCRMGGVVMDGSIRNQLKNLRENLSAN